MLQRANWQAQGVADLRRVQCSAPAYSCPVSSETLLDFIYDLGPQGQIPRRAKRLFREVRSVQVSRN